MEEDELMEEISTPEIYDAFFQFEEDEPVLFATVQGGKLTITLEAIGTETPEIIFGDGKGNFFKIFLQKQHVIQQEIF